MADEARKMFKFHPINSRVPESQPVEPNLLEQMKEYVRPYEERRELERQRDAAKFVLPKALDRNGE